MSQRVLIVSPHFPPSSLAGVHRARHLAKHLPSHGWQPSVIRVHERHYTEPPDSDLAELVPASVHQIRTGALPAEFARRCGVGDIGIRAYLSLKRGIAEGVAQVNPQAIIITGSPFYPMTLAGWASRRFRVPVVLDFQDPWVSAHGATHPRWSKAGLSHRLARVLEPWAVKQAAWITSVSSRQNDEMAARYPWLDAHKMSAIPIGGDPEDFDCLRGSMKHSSSKWLEPGKVNFCYVGTFLPRAVPVVRTLFRAFADLKAEAPEIACRLRFVFVGTSNQPSEVTARDVCHLVAPIAAEEGVIELVKEYPARVPYMEALSILANAQALLLLGSDEPHYTASKIYPALMSGRPWLSMYHADSSAHALLMQAGGGAALSFKNEAELFNLRLQLKDHMIQLAHNPRLFGRADADTYRHYTAHAIAGQFASVFEAIVTGKPNQTPEL